MEIILVFITIILSSFLIGGTLIYAHTKHAVPRQYLTTGFYVMAFIILLYLYALMYLSG